MKTEQLKPFVKVRYFQPNYPERSGNKTNRLAVTYYYHGHIESISDERDLTEKEKKDGFSVEFYSINQIQEMLNSKKVIIQEGYILIGSYKQLLITIKKDCKLEKIPK